MRKTSILLALLILLAVPLAAQADAPRRLVGFTLGDNVSLYDDLVLKDSAVPIHDEPYLSEVDLKHYALPGISDGTLLYGNCASPGKLVRVKLRLTDNSRDFFEKLLITYKTKFGEPDVWRGDAFHNRIFWKWSFKEPDGTNISVILGHSKDPEDKPGNSIKFTLRSAWEAEMACYHKKGQSPKKGGKTEPSGKGTIEDFVPR